MSAKSPPRIHGPDQAHDLRARVLTIDRGSVETDSLAGLVVLLKAAFFWCVLNDGDDDIETDVAAELARFPTAAGATEPIRARLVEALASTKTELMFLLIM